MLLKLILSMTWIIISPHCFYPKKYQELCSIYSIRSDSLQIQSKYVSFVQRFSCGVSSRWKHKENSIQTVADTTGRWQAGKSYSWSSSRWSRSIQRYHRSTHWLMHLYLSGEFLFCLTFWEYFEFKIGTKAKSQIVFYIKLIYYCIYIVYAETYIIV